MSNTFPMTAGDGRDVEGLKKEEEETSRHASIAREMKGRNLEERIFQAVVYLFCFVLAWQ